MADTNDIEEATRTLVTALFRELRAHERAVRLRPDHWMDLIGFGGQSVMGLTGYGQLVAALKEAFPDRFAGPVGTHELPEQYVWAMLNGAVLQAAAGHAALDLRPAEVGVAVLDMVDLVRRERDQAIGARVLTDIAVDAPLHAGSVELRPVGNWGLNDAYRDIDGLIPGSGGLLDADIRYRTGGSFTYATLRTDADAPIGDRIHAGYAVASATALARLETLTAAIRLATATTAQIVVDITSAPGYTRIWPPEIVRHAIDDMELVQRISPIGPELGAPLAALGDRLAAWGGTDLKPHSLGIALSRFGRSYVTRPWFDMLVDVAIGLEAALLGRNDNEEISLRLRSRAAGLLATPTDPAATIYEDVKSLYKLRSMIVHGSNPKTETLETLVYAISAAARSPYKGDKWALAMDRCRDLLRRAILARGFLTDAGEWPTSGKPAERFDVDGLLTQPTTRENLRETWRTALQRMDLASAADQAPPASIGVALPDHSYGHSEPPPMPDSGAPDQI